MQWKRFIDGNPSTNTIFVGSEEPDTRDTIDKLGCSARSKMINAMSYFVKKMLLSTVSAEQGQVNVN